MLAFGVGNAWAESWTYTFKSPDAVKNNSITVNGATWNVNTTIGTGSPTISTGTYSKTYGLKFGSNKTNYYKTVVFTTDYFNNYNVSEVVVKILLNGAVNTTLTTKQGDITIGSASFKTFQQWIELTTNTTKGSGGQLSLTIATTQAFYISSITVNYEIPSVTPDPVDPNATFLNGSYTVGGSALDLSTLWNSNSEGAVTYSILEAGTTGASINDKSFTATAAGTCTVKASQAATSAYNAIEKTATITVTAPTPATITLSEAGQEKTVEGKYVGDSYELPLTSTQTCVKQFVGWSTEEIEESLPEKPTSNFYEPGADFTLTAEEHILYAVYATAAEGELTSIFSETFDACDGTGGNDSKWSGDIAKSNLSLTGWDCIKGYAAKGCAKFGGGSDKGSAETPAIALTGDATLTFKAAAWSGDGKTLNLSATGATLGESSVTLKEAEWTEYTVAIKGATGSVNIKFEAKIATKNRFFLDDVVVSQGSITYSDYSTTCAVAPDAPEFSVAAGTYNAPQTVTITAEDGATIYYTLDGNNPTNESNVYSSALTISETTTLKAIAVKDGLSSAITTATYTIKLPLTTIDQIFAKATEVGGTATAVEITMGGWIVSGANDKNVFVTDGTKGFIIYKSDGGHGFNVGDVLSGTVACKVQLFKGSAELTELTSTTSGLAVTTGGTVTPVTLDAAGITALTGVNTGSVIKINGTCTLENSKYYVAGVQLYNTLYEFQTLEPSAEYNVTGVYQLYTTTKEILPRQEADIEKIESLPTATISIADITMEVEETKTITATIYPAAAADAVVYSTTSSCISISGNTITGVTEGTATVTATIANADGEYYGTTKDFTVTVTPKSTKDNVVVLAKYGDQWYAMMAQYVSGKTSHLAALPVSYVGGKLYNVADADKALIEWTRAVVDGKATFSNNSKYLTGKSDETDLTLAATSCDWTISGESYLIGERTFFYSAENNWFRNFKIENVDAKNYSGMPVVTAPVYTTGNLYTIKATAENGTVVGAGVYVAGDKVTLTADPAMDYTFVNWTKGGEVVSTANPFVFEATENLDLVANFTAISQTSKTLSGKFSTGEYEYAEFATGNLQYNVKDEKWSVAKQQYQYIGDANINVGDPNYKGWIDMFGWSTNETNYGVDPRNVNEFYDGEFVDWGNIEELGDGWSTLSADQWKYLLNERTNASSLKQIARVGSVVGIMLFPDNWNAPLTVTAQPDSYFDVDIHNYTLEQWAELEEAGALFLPAAGRRTGGHGNMINYDQQVETREDYLVNGGFYRWQDNTNIYCYYWTSTINEDKNVSYLHNIQALGDDKHTIGTGAVWGEKGRYGQSVRLAKVTSTLVELGDGDNSEVLNNNNGETVNVEVTRQFTAGNLYTISLPFALNDVVSVFGEGTIVYEYAELAQEGGDVVLYFKKVNSLESGKPYLIKPAQAVPGFVVENVTLSNATNNISFTAGQTTITMIPLLSAAGKTNGLSQYWLAGDTYLYNNQTDILGLRALFDLSTKSGLAPRARVAFGENAATGLDNIINGENTTIKVIENGQLIIIRNGEKFNAQGVRF